MEWGTVQVRKSNRIRKAESIISVVDIKQGHNSPSTTNDEEITTVQCPHCQRAFSPPKRVLSAGRSRQMLSLRRSFPEENGKRNKATIETSSIKRKLQEEEEFEDQDTPKSESQKKKSKKTQAQVAKIETDDNKSKH
ncbi:hypothetical protein RND71_033850 [Anisodus tanguticus]|uniref:Uncharacterized protein n=1 Tax=Anisodus tanguticus TaxID=243964 RepID=A0AAE1RA41_9SOLA|nr:hypothetical protein RND71_033850 [Anisodus tanguticus]